MKSIFIETKYKGKAKIPKLDILPKKIMIVTTVQFLDYIDEIALKIKEAGKVPIIGQSEQPYLGQILGCDVYFKNKEKFDAFFYIGDGKFHPIKLAFIHKKDVFTLNPFIGKIEKLDNKIVEQYEKKKKGAYLKFLTNSVIGVLFTTKSGQNQSINIIQKLEEKFPDKKFYIFIADEINFQSLENFPFIKAWINTACPRIEEDFRCVNLSDVLTK